MNTKTEKQIADIKSQTIGVEIEMNNITRMNAAKLAAEYFGTHRYADTARINGYYTWSAWDAQGREWKFQRDVSIAGDDAHKCEMVTPILTYADIETLQELCRKLRRDGAEVRVCPDCGARNALSEMGLTPEEIQQILNTVHRYTEPLLAPV